MNVPVPLGSFAFGRSALGTPNSAQVERKGCCWWVVSVSTRRPPLSESPPGPVADQRSAPANERKAPRPSAGQSGQRLAVTPMRLKLSLNSGPHVGLLSTRNVSQAHRADCSIQACLHLVGQAQRSEGAPASRCVSSGASGLRTTAHGFYGAPLTALGPGGGLPGIISLTQIYLPFKLLIQQTPQSV